MKTVIELDCGDIPPGCGFACGSCIQEIQDLLGTMDGILGFAQHLDSKIEIEHDLGKVSPQDLLEAISKLPSEHDGFFRPILIDTEEGTMTTQNSGGS
jgi:hypothetical protein